MGSSVSTSIGDGPPHADNTPATSNHSDDTLCVGTKEMECVGNSHITKDLDGDSREQSKDLAPGQELRRHLTKKTDIVSDPRMFQMVDQHARNTPQEMSSNPDRLVTYLMSSCTSTLHTVRIFYMWITNNIRCVSYTDESLTGLEFKPTTVLARKEATRVGMNLLFYYFCSQVRIPCSLIHGVQKHDNQKTSSLRASKIKPNHAWLLVLVQDQWRFIDCACERGLKEDKKETALRREFFFLPDPELLINSHFPMGMTNDMDIPGLQDAADVSRGLQMLEKPFTFGQFWRQAMKSLSGMSISLQLLTHLSCTVRIDKGEQLSFRSPDLEDIAGILTDKTSGETFPHSILCMRTSSSEFRIFIKPQKVGNYKLDVVGKIRGSLENSYRKLIDYEVIVHAVEDQFSPFPNHFGVWGAKRRALHLGFSRRIFKFDTLSCRTGDVYMKLPLANQIRVKAVITPAITDTKDTTTNRDHEASTNSSTLTMFMDGVVHIKARFDSPGFYTLALHGQTQHPSGQLLTLTTSSPFIKVADFLVTCRRRSSYSSPLPKSFATCQQYQCLLLEPLHRDLIVDHPYTFQVASPYMEVMKVDGECMVRETRAVNDDGLQTVWTLNYTPKSVGSSVYLYGSVKHSNTTIATSALSALFVYRVVEDVSFGRKEPESV